MYYVLMLIRYRAAITRTSGVSSGSRCAHSPTVAGMSRCRLYHHVVILSCAAKTRLFFTGIRLWIWVRAVFYFLGIGWMLSLRHNFMENTYIMGYFFLFRGSWFKAYVGIIIMNSTNLFLIRGWTIHACIVLTAVRLQHTVKASAALIVFLSKLPNNIT